MTEEIPEELQDEVEADLSDESQPEPEYTGSFISVRAEITEEGMSFSSAWSFGPELDDENCTYYRTLLDGLILSLMADPDQFIDTAHIGHNAVHRYKRQVANATKVVLSSEDFTDLPDNVILFPTSPTRH